MAHEGLTDFITSLASAKPYKSAGGYWMVDAGKMDLDTREELLDRLQSREPEPEEAPPTPKSPFDADDDDLPF